MRMLVQLFLGLLALKAVVASPRFSRQVDLDTYDSTSYDVDLDNFNLENPELYDYEDSLTIDDPQIEIGTLAPPDYNYHVPEVSLDEQEQVEDEEEPLKPQLTPQGSGGSGVLMGPDTQKEVELRLTPIDILHVSGDFGGSVASGASEASGASGVSGSGVSGDLVDSSASGGSGDIILMSGTSEELISSDGSGEFLTSGDILISGDFLISGDLSGSGDMAGSTASGASGDLGSGELGIEVELSGESADQSGSGSSGDLLVSGTSVGSGASGESGESGDLAITLISGEELPLIPNAIPSEASGASGEISGASGEISGASGETSGASGDVEASVDHEASVDLAESGATSVSGSGSAEAEVPDIILVPDTDKEEGLLPTTPETPQEGAGTVEGSVTSGLPEPEEPEEPIKPDEPEKPHKPEKPEEPEEPHKPEEPQKPEEPEIDRTGMPTCLLCTCIGGSVYCDDLKLDSVPPLPKDTTHFYARFNRITKINKSDFASMNKLKRIDLTSNEIATIEDETFVGLPELAEVVIRENHITQLPGFPPTMTLIDASHNNIGTKGLHHEAFKDMTGLLYLYLTDNRLDYIPVPLPDSLRSLHLQRNNIQMMHEDTFCNLKDFNYIRNALEDIRLDENPINLSRTPQAYICLPRIPIGDLI